MSNKRKIEVVEYQESWIEKFESEKNLLERIFRNSGVTIEHIGSTSVPGLAAKPIIDILIEIPNLSMVENKNSELESLGYKVKGENGIEGRRYFQKGANKRSHQVHIFEPENKHLIRHRAFRDYLIAHSEVALEYGKVKRNAARKCNHNILIYMELKDAFIKRSLEKAMLWYTRK